jgi:hypothetical protein
MSTILAQQNPIIDLTDLEMDALQAETETAEERALITNVYAIIKQRLVQKGIPAEEIAFIHDADTTEKKEALGKAVNEGKIRILLGSTEKMGTGMNAQERLIATHHLTPPWRPADLEQRNGRMVRNGNKYPEVYEFAYATPGSFDGYMWQLLENKAAMFTSFRDGTIGREAGDIAEQVLSYAELKALSSGNPKIMQKVELDSKMARLEIMRQDWTNQRANMHSRERMHEKREPLVRADKDAVKKAIETRDSFGDAKFSITIAGRVYTKREDAGKAMRAALATVKVDADVRIGEYKGIPLIARAERKYRGEWDILTGFDVGSKLYVINPDVSDAGLVQSLDARMRSLEKELDKINGDLEEIETDRESIARELAKPWELEDEYEETARAVAELSAELSIDEAETPEGEEKAETELPLDGGDESWREVYEQALGRIRAMHANPEVLSRFNAADQLIEVSPEKAQELKAEAQAIGILAAATALPLFFDPEPEPEPIPAFTPPSGAVMQLSFLADVPAQAPVVSKRRR